MITAIEKSSFIKSLDKWKPSTEVLPEDERAAYQSSFDVRGAYKQSRDTSGNSTFNQIKCE